MVKKIDRDHTKFRNIVRGKIREDLKKYISRGELIGKKGKDLVSIPLPQIDIPRFRYETRKFGGVGQGDGEPGQSLGGGSDGSGSSGAGNLPGYHILEVDITIEELAKMLGEELELPRIKPKGQKIITSEKRKYASLRRVGPEALRVYKRTFREALKRQMAEGTYNRRRPVIVPFHDDKRYRSWKTIENPESNALIFYLMDVSGSMGDEQKEIVRTQNFWIDTWLRSQYHGIRIHYITHDAVAREVGQHEFYHTRQSGGTKISSGYRYIHKMIIDLYSSQEWNIYIFHYSDGDNWSGGDTDECLALLEQELLSACNLFCYGQVESPYGSGQFLKDLQGKFGVDNKILVMAEIKDKDGIYDAIKKFLGKGQ